MNDDELAKFRGLAKTEIPDLPSDLREPLHSLQADTSYLIGRVQSDSSVGGMVANSIKSRLSHIEEAAYRLNAKAHARADLMKEVREALEATEVLDNRDDCPECHGEGEPEQCELCFPAADDARLKRRDVLSKLGEA